MKKTPIFLFFIIAMMVSQAVAQDAGRYPRAPQVSPSVVKLLNAYNRLNRANKQAGTNTPFGQSKTPFGSFSKVNPNAPGTSSLAAIPTLPSGDRPFDANAPTNNPFMATVPSSSSLASPSVAFAPGVDAFSPSQLTVNPFIPGNLSPVSSLVPKPSIVPPSAGISPGNSLNTSQTAQVIAKSPQPQLNPLAGPFQQSNPITSSPYSSPPISDPLSAYKSPYSLNSLFSGSAFQSPTSP